jgi:hypothetical protein
MWLFVIEYATLNSQKAYNGEKTSEGYMQGGLGDGVTTLKSAEWTEFSNSTPFVPCGTTDSLGNGTGTVSYTIDNTSTGGTVTKTFDVPRYRGIENPFGHIYKWVDGLNVRVSPTVENGGDGLSKVYVCSDPAKFSDTGYTGYTYIGDETREENYVKEIIGGDRGDIMPKATGASSSTYFCDGHATYTKNTEESLRGVRFGGPATIGATCGFAFASSYGAPASADAHIGSRLCFIP